MKKLLCFLIISWIYVLLIPKVVAFENLQQPTKGWKAGVARVKITPTQPMAMAGYASRTHPSEGTLHDLWAKALLIEDSSGKQGVLVTTDLLGLQKKISDNIRDRIKQKFGLGRDQVILNSSHTHCGPVLESALSDMYELDKSQLELVRQYSRSLEDQIVNLVGEALKDKEPADLYVQNGVTRFQVNRRNNDESLLTQLSELNGPSDYAVPVIKLVNVKGDIKAVAFGYSCHATVLNNYEWSGDYPGFAQLELEKSHPGVIALFFQSAGADQNPLPRRTVPLAQQYGRELAAAVERVLQENMRKLPGRLMTTYSEINLPLASPRTEEELKKMSETSSVNYEKNWSTRMLNQIRRKDPFMKSYPYPIQVWSIGGLPLVSLGGELVVEYSIKIKQVLGPEAVVLGYSNDVMGYIPSSTILKEGGYEGDFSHIVYGLPAKWHSSIETRILNEVIKLAEQAGILKD